MEIVLLYAMSIEAKFLFMIKINILFIFIFICSKTHSNEFKVFYKCYSQITGGYPSLSYITKKMKDKNFNGIDECIEILKNVKISKNEKIKKPSPVSLKVLNYFNQIHKDWFLIKGIRNISNSFSYDSSMDYFDVSESALYLTNALFNRNFKFKEIVTSNKNLKALRLNKNKLGAYSGQDFRKTSIYASKECRSNMKKCSSLFTGTGPLVGIKEEEPRQESFHYKHGKKSYRGKTSFGVHFGGGILGSQYYILANIVENYGYRSDGLVEVGRVWATAVMNDLLCRKLPTLKIADVRHDKKGQLIRNNRNCLKCHATIDQLSGVIRNFNFKKNPMELSNKYPIGRNNAPFLAEFHKVQNYDESKVWATNRDEFFYKTKPIGKLFYRNDKDILIDIKLESLQDLGRVLSQQKDFYRCFVSRYYRHFLDREKLDQKDLIEVDHLSGKLMKTQNLKSLIIKLLKLSEYKVLK